MQKDFNRWNRKKKGIDITEIKYDFFYHEREVWWTSIGLNVGVEEDGKNELFERPVLVVKKFNKHMFWGIPLTTRSKEVDFYHRIEYSGGVAWALLTQLKLFSAKRLLRKVDSLSIKEILYIKEKLHKLLDR